MDIPLDQFRGTIRGSLLRDNLLSPPHLLEIFAPASQSTQSSQATDLSMSANHQRDPNADFDMQSIVDSGINESVDWFYDEFDPNPVKLLPILVFQSAIPTDRYGRKDLSETLPDIISDVLAVYGHWFLNINTLHMYEAPTKPVMLEFIRIAKLYIAVLGKNHPSYMD
ncbi:hypothetical protein DL98DRAFT_597727 [Cadophora sp. DSE1049]|nr:hypothetical protein DL98DRAFT_597727 [Cadophora sp. DSE1049]